MSDGDDNSSYYITEYLIMRQMQCKQFMCTASFNPYSDPVTDAKIISIVQMGKMLVQEYNLSGPYD